MSKRAELRERRHRAQQRQKYIWFGVIGVLLAVVIIFFILPNIPGASAKRDGLSMGDPNAPVQVVEFSDFQCPYCGLFHTTYEPDFIKNYVDTGDVFYSYVPLAFVGSESVQAAKGAYCANEEGKFWEYHDILFNNQNGENQGAFADEYLISFAGEIGLDESAFTACLASDQFDAKLSENDTYAQSVGATYTPSFLVNGTLVDMSQLDSEIEKALEAAK